jgi:hypothetical protein
LPIIHIHFDLDIQKLSAAVREPAKYSFDGKMLKRICRSMMATNADN